MPLASFLPLLQLLSPNISLLRGGTLESFLKTRHLTLETAESDAKHQSIQNIAQLRLHLAAEVKGNADYGNTVATNPA
jgi:hypothetical protein